MGFKRPDHPFNKLEDYEIKANNEEIVEWFRKVRAACTGSESSSTIISDIQEILEKNDIDLYGEKSPYYNFLLAYVHDFFGDSPDDAIKNIESSASGFMKLGKDKDWQRVISYWFYGLLLCKQGQLDRAKAKIDDAIKIITKMDKEQHHFGQYSKEYTDMIETIKVSNTNMRANLKAD